MLLVEVEAVPKRGRSIRETARMMTRAQGSTRNDATVAERPADDRWDYTCQVCSQGGEMLCCEVKFPCAEQLKLIILFLTYDLAELVWMQMMLLNVELCFKYDCVVGVFVYCCHAPQVLWAK